MSTSRFLEQTEVGEEVCREVRCKASMKIVSGYREDSIELMLLFHCSTEKLSDAESPLICEHGNADAGSKL